MKNRAYGFEITSDVTEVECELTDARLSVCASDDGTFRAEFSTARGVNVGYGESSLVIHTRKRPFYDRTRPEIKLYVPAYVVPSLTVRGKRADFSVDKGIYGDLTVNLQSGSVSVCACALKSAEIYGGDAAVKVSDATAKGNLIVQLEHGNILSENTFACRAELRVKCGNVGCVNLNCKEGVTEAGEGNVSASLAGKEEDYNLNVLAKAGTANLASKQSESATKTFQIYSGKGNVMLEFADKNEEE